MDMLSKVTIRGFKSIRDCTDLELRARNILIGANGAGKTNFISFFRMLRAMASSPGGLQEFIARQGGANAILHDGAATTRELFCSLLCEAAIGRVEYEVRLAYAAPDTLIFADESYRFSRNGYETRADWQGQLSGHRESGLFLDADEDDRTAKHILWLLKQCVVHQFHNTSETARIRQKWRQDDNWTLKEDGANLGPFLYRLRERYPKYYTRIVETVRQMVPFFSDFELQPDHGAIYLQWRERGSDQVFGAHQASDGMLRMMALVALLLQPTDTIPSVLLLDEPELGLHPFAITVIAGLIRSVSLHRQVILATQSMTFIDCFEPEDVIVVDRPDDVKAEGLRAGEPGRPTRETTFRRLDPARLKEWLEEYSVAELWEKNVIGGRPSR